MSRQFCRESFHILKRLCGRASDFLDVRLDSLIVSYSEIDFVHAEKYQIFDVKQKTLVYNNFSFSKRHSSLQSSLYQQSIFKVQLIEILETYPLKTYHPI